MNNLLKNIPDTLPVELFESLVETKDVHIERIVSRGHTSPGEGWYEQDRNEFVLLMKGAARLEFDGGRTVNMAPGDWLVIPVGVKHRVVWTDREEETVWLAVHYP